MDRADVALCKELLKNSRTSYQALAKILGISVPAVHKRVKELMGQGVIRGFVAEIDITSVNGLSVMVFGRTEAPLATQVMDRLGKDRSTWMVLLGGGNQIYINAFLRTASEIEPYLEFVKEAGIMPHPMFGIHSLRPEGLKLVEGSGEITPLERRIIGSLSHDSRKKLSDVGMEVGVSARTVGNKLSRLIDEGKVRLTIDWSPNFSRDIVTMFHLNLAEGVERSKAFALLRERFPENIIMTSAFSNIHDLMLATIWTSSMREVEIIMEGMYGSGLFSDIVPHMIYSGRRYETWKDRLIEQKIGGRKS